MKQFFDLYQEIVCRLKTANYSFSYDTEEEEEIHKETIYVLPPLSQDPMLPTFVEYLEKLNNEYSALHYRFYLKKFGKSKIIEITTHLYKFVENPNLETTFDEMFDNIKTYTLDSFGKPTIIYKHCEMCGCADEEEKKAKGVVKCSECD